MKTYDWVDVARARGLAYHAHGTQLYDHRPYVEHLDHVVRHLQHYGSMISVVGYLHDIVEDTSATLDDVAQNFDWQIAHAVDLVSDRPGPNRRARKAQSRKRLAACDARNPVHIAALITKAGDRLANLETCVKYQDSRLKMYCKEHTDFTAAVYRPGLCEGLWQRMSKIMVSALVTLNGDRSL